MKLDLEGNLHLALSQEAATSRSAEKDAVRALIPREYAPEMPFSSLGRTIYINLVLEDLPDWDRPPPIPHEIAENVRIYSTWRRFIGKAPDSVEDPQVRDKLYDAMRSMRTNKRVRYKPDARLFETYGAWRDSAFAYTRDYVRDGELDGLERYSRMYCFDAIELLPNPNEPRYEGWRRNKAALEQKAVDDPSPDNCVVNRYNSTFVNPNSDDSRSWLIIKCQPVLEECTASFVAATRLVEVDFSYHDLPLWRNIVGPVQKTIDGFVTDQ